jgi:Flp pilus assembly protein TadB
MRERRSLRVILTILLLCSAGLFAAGVAKERHDVERERASEAAATSTQAAKTGEPAANHAGEGGESAAKHAAEGGTETAAHRRAEGSSERVFGVNTESTALVAAAVATSVLLALALWLAPRLTLLLFAIVVAGLHLAAALTAATLMRAPRARHQGLGWRASRPSRTP